MDDKRLSELKYWLMESFGSLNFSIASANNDASFRRYFRIKHGSKSLIAMDSPPKKENTASFVAVAKLLRANNVYAPKIINYDLKQGFLLLEDLGDNTFLQALDNTCNFDLYQTAIDELIKIQKINVQNQTLPEYNYQLLNTEMQLLIDWYLPKNLPKNQQNELSKVFTLLSKNALDSPQVFVHRDYHSRNLILTNNQSIAVIDFQDASIGSNTYDIVSLLKDAYFELSVDEQQKLLCYYYDKTNIKMVFTKFKKQFELIGVQRHLKVLGIFKRLSTRDNKHQYLANIPLVKKYILQVANKYPELSVLTKVL